MLSVPLWYRYPTLNPTFPVPCDSSLFHVKPPLCRHYCAFIVVILAKLHLSSQTQQSPLDTTRLVQHSVKSISKSVSYSIKLLTPMAAEELPIPTVEDITRLTQSVSCADNRLTLPMSNPNPVISNLLLIGKIISQRNFHAPVLHDIVMRAWNPSRRISVKKIDRNTFVFSFEHETDRSLAYNRRPWTIRGAHLVLKIWSPELALTEIDFTSSMFWIQVHGLPPIWCNKENIKLVGSKAGSVVEVEFSEAPSGIWQRFARVRINVNVNMPLCPGVFLPRHERHDIWISLKYERLPEFCFRCGIIGHTNIHCEKNRVVLTNEFGRKFPAFGEWLHSGNDKTPPGIYDNTPEITVPALLQAVPMLEETASAMMQTTPSVQVVVKDMKTSVQCEDTPRTDGNDIMGRSRSSADSNTAKVSSFVRLLEHSFKNAYCDSNASTSVSHTDTVLVGTSTAFVPETNIDHLVGPHTHNNPQSPVINQLPSTQPTVPIEPTPNNVDFPLTDPVEAHHTTQTLQSQLPCTLEPPLPHPRSHITNQIELPGIEYKINFPLSPKVVILYAPLFTPPPTPTPINSNAPTPVKKADPPPPITINQTTPSLDPANQETLATHDLKRKDHPDSPCNTPKKLRHEDARLEASGSQFWGFQPPDYEDAELHKDEESSKIPITPVEETGLSPSPKTP
jgi:hypothetical protein